MTAETNDRGSMGWIGYRLMNDHRFDDAVVRAVYRSCEAAGIDYMELGYKASRRIFAGSKAGPWKFCDEADLRRIVGEKKGGLKLSVMADAERTDYHTDILPREKSVLDMIRVATYIHQIPTAADMVKDAHDKGYETTVNLMAVSTVSDWELDSALKVLAATPVDVLYVVDSFGSLYSEQIHALIGKFMAAGAGKQVGIHTHNNRQLAYANTIEAIIQGANYMDASMAGLGRGAGNCPMELLLGFLHNPKFRLRPVLECIQDTIEPLRRDFHWGYSIPYMLTGQLNLHPRDAMAHMEGPERDRIVTFFDSVIEEE
jgi:4-hydroxy 2-oxovalerate aldolase